MTDLDLIGKFYASKLVELRHVSGSTALFGPMGLADPYRYALTRKVGPGVRRLLFAMLNPSKATHEKPDPTITRCIGFARHWGFGFLDVVNAYAFRATDPSEMLATAEPIGEHNDVVVRMFARRAELVVCAWGTKAGPRGDAMKKLLTEAHGKPLKALRLTKDGHPEHPLYIPADIAPAVYA